MLKKNKIFILLMLFISLVFMTVSCSKSNSDPKVSVILKPQKEAKPRISFNEVTYSLVYHEFIAAGENQGKALIVTSPDGVTWKKHELNQVGTITSLVVNDNGVLYYDLEIPGSTDGSVYRVDNLNHTQHTWKAVLQQNYKSYENVVKSVKNYQAIYELRTIDNKIFRVYRILIKPNENNVSPPKLIYTGKDITDIECSEDDSSVLLLFRNKRILVSRNPNISNSFIPTNPVKTESGVMSETIASGIYLVSKVRTKDRESNIIEIYYTFNNKENLWKEIKRFTLTTIDKDEFSADVNLNYEKDTFIDIDRTTNNTPELVTGSIIGESRFTMESYSDNLPRIAQRTCAAGAIINGESIIVILGDDNKILRSRDNKNWQVITIQ